MNINKIGGVSGNYPSGKYANFHKDNQVNSDSVNISEAAKNRISLQKALELVKNSPDLRMDKVAEAKANLEGYFTEGNINSEITEKIAKKIVEDMRRGLV